MITQAVSSSGSSSLLSSITEPIAEFSKDRLGRIAGLVCAVLGLGVGFLAISCPIPVALRTLMAIGSALSLAFAGAIYHFSRKAVQSVVGDSPNIGADKESQEKYRAEIMQQTLANLKAKSYVSPDGSKHSLDVESPVSGVKLALGPFPESAAVLRPGSCKTKLSIQKEDCLYVAKKLHDKGLKPCVLDMAADHHFGGAYLKGSRAQEEEICRRTTLAVIEPATKKNYPLHRNSEAAGLYVPNVTVFRDGYGKSYQYLNHPFPIGVGIVAAFRKPNLNDKGKLMEPLLSHTRDKIRNFFDMAHQSGHKSVVFGAFGCGAFENPPDHIAEIALDVINREFKSCFEEIVFAVIEDNNSKQAHNPQGNFLPFARAIKAAGGKAFDDKGAEITDLG